MKKQVTKFLSILLAVAIVSSCSFAFAANGIDERGHSGDISLQFTNCSGVAAGLNISTWGKATCSYDVELRNSTDTAKVNMYLQRYKDGAWRNVTSWTATGSGFFSGSRKYYVTSGYDYRVGLAVYIYNSSGNCIEGITQNSRIEHY